MQLKLTHNLDFFNITDPEIGQTQTQWNWNELVKVNYMFFHEYQLSWLGSQTRQWHSSNFIRTYISYNYHASQTNNFNFFNITHPEIGQTQSLELEWIGKAEQSIRGWGQAKFERSRSDSLTAAGQSVTLIITKHKHQFSCQPVKNYKWKLTKQKNH